MKLFFTPLFLSAFVVSTEARSVRGTERQLFSMRRGNQECPVSDAATPCITVFAPVVCGEDECVYDNSCHAEAAGFVAEEDCVAMECPTESPLVPCTLEYWPVKCGLLECEYANLCLATKAAGFDEKECVALNCPVAKEDTPCPFIYLPVWCEKACVYDNRCLSENAGYASDQCTEL